MSSPLPLLRAARRLTWRVALIFVIAGANSAAQENAHTKSDAAKAAAPALDHSAEGEIARYCAALAPGASEARAAYQIRRLNDLQAQVQEAVEKLEVKETEAREWVNKREAMMKAAKEDIVAIYAKMAPEAAAQQMNAMDDAMAAAVLAKLNARTASAILTEMPAEKAARLAGALAGATPAEKT